MDSIKALVLVGSKPQSIICVDEPSSIPVPGQTNYRTGVERTGAEDLDDCTIRPDGLPLAADYMPQEYVRFWESLYETYRENELPQVEALLSVVEELSIHQLTQPSIREFIQQMYKARPSGN
jgi:hypothetical protein